VPETKIFFNFWKNRGKWGGRGGELWEYCMHAMYAHIVYHIILFILYIDRFLPSCGASDSEPRWDDELSRLPAYGAMDHDFRRDDEVCCATMNPYLRRDDARESKGVRQ